MCRERSNPLPAFLLYASIDMTFATVFPPMPTPFANGDVDTRAVAHNIGRWLRAGLGGIVALGSNGEAPLLDETG